MSICRWSSDNFKSDLYIYESKDGYCLHIAGKRIISKIPIRPSFKLLGKSEKLNRRFVKQGRIHSKAVRKAKREDILLKYAGQSFTFETANECAEIVKELIGLGYHVPKYVLQVLQDEQDEQD